MTTKTKTESRGSVCLFSTPQADGAPSTDVVRVAIVRNGKMQVVGKPNTEWAKEAKTLTVTYRDVPGDEALERLMRPGSPYARLAAEVKPLTNAAEQQVREIFNRWSLDG